MVCRWNLFYLNVRFLGSGVLFAIDSWMVMIPRLIELSKSLGNEDVHVYESIQGLKTMLELFKKCIIPVKGKLSTITTNLPKTAQSSKIIPRAGHLMPKEVSKNPKMHLNLAQHVSCNYNNASTIKRLHWLNLHGRRCTKKNREDTVCYSTYRKETSLL